MRTVYIADDGKEFDDEYECEHYEWKLKHPNLTFVTLFDKDKNVIKTLFGSGTKDTNNIKWMAETGILGTSSPDKKYISRLTIRLMMDIGARVVFSIQYDSTGEWENVCTLVGHNLKTFSLPIRPKRCDHFRLRVEGEGNVKIFSISKITEQGSDA